MSGAWRPSEFEETPAFDEPAFGDAAFGRTGTTFDTYDDAAFGALPAATDPFDPFDFGTDAVPFDAGSGQTGFDEGTDGPGTGLVLAPPSLPTRWDAVDQAPAPVDRNRPAPLYDDSAFGSPDPAFSSPSPYDDSAFGGLAPAVHAPAATQAPEPQHVPGTPASLLADTYRVCFRLTGVREIADAVSVDAVAMSATPQAPHGDPLITMSTAVRRCIEQPLPDEQRIPYHQHRARLRRDLARRDDTERAILAMRHLVVVPPSGVAARLGLPESQVREVASAWCPDDSRVDSLALLRGIDSWISTDLGSVAAGGGTELAHLDDTGA